MLDPQEKAVFDGMVTHLRSADPGFARRMDRISRPRRRPGLAAMILLSMLAPLSIVYGGWLGMLVAVTTVAYGAQLLRRRRVVAPEPLWWTSTRGRRPGAAPSI